MIRDELGRRLYPIAGRRGCYETAGDRRARLAREARRLELDAARQRAVLRAARVAGQQLAAFAVDVDPTQPPLFADLVH